MWQPRDTAFLDFVEQTFGTATALRVLNQDGTIGHAEVTIGDSVVMVFDVRPEWPDIPSLLSVYVDDVDEVVARAIDAEASVTEVTTSRIIGDRGGRSRIRSGTSGGSSAPGRRRRGHHARVVRRSPGSATMRHAQESFAAEMRRRL